MPLTLVQFLCASFLALGLTAMVLVLDEIKRKKQQSFFLQKQAAIRNGIFKEDTLLRNGPNFIFFHEQIKLEVAYEYQKTGMPVTLVRAFTEYPIHDSLEISSKSLLCLFADASAIKPLRGIGDHLFDKKFFIQTSNISFAQDILTKDTQLYLRGINSDHLFIRIKKADQAYRQQSLPEIYFKESVVEVLSYYAPEHEFEYDSLINVAIELCQRLKELMRQEMDDQISNLNLKTTATHSQDEEKPLIEARKQIQ